jgi:PTS system nitrogen regulatory IIA component
MIDIARLLTVERIRCHVDVGSKKRALETLAGIFAANAPGFSDQQVFDALIGRERLGSTGLGHGIALPHGRVETLENPLCAVLTLNTGVDFDAPDGELVDILFALMMPANSNEQHLQILAGVAEMFSDPGLREKLRSTQESDQLLDTITGWQAQHSAS